MSLNLPATEDVFSAAQRIAPFVHETPLMTSERLSDLAGAELYFKCEHLQKVGAFKARGAVNAVLQLPPEQKLVATHSSGNHGAALAWAAAASGRESIVVMPENAPAVKKAAVAGYGAKVVECGPTLANREAALADVVSETGAHVVPPYDDPRIIAGQGTVGVELVRQCRERGFVPDLVVAPIGGGGLLAGTGLALRGLLPECKLIGAEPAGAADAHLSLRSGVRRTDVVSNTIADGLRTTIGERNFAVVRDTVQDIVTVSEDGIRDAMHLIWSRMKQLVEPSAAVSLAGVFEHASRFRGKKVVLVLSGGNVDMPAPA
ncbi:threonine ammonia-lyase [Biformimicrobium ophioploci]|uniref:Pyridoxal-phosphate dependent enzyme n=1 Tax=Biformimicrobium ophioploci TaxID=3036711 RepID=A0ABQ6LXH7_9GAMM|nr:threonine/serine dehydratase [Microbulbifer sp. NKW57]GMG86816.1 pyridoxal-phosphate dependent enzyme [Microbulbifer sp. NKW57]